MTQAQGIYFIVAASHDNPTTFEFSPLYLAFAVPSVVLLFGLTFAPLRAETGSLPSFPTG
jgi:hypothetical protein